MRDLVGEVRSLRRSGGGTSLTRRLRLGLLWLACALLLASSGGPTAEEADVALWDEARWDETRWE